MQGKIFIGESSRADRMLNISLHVVRSRVSGIERLSKRIIRDEILSGLSHTPRDRDGDSRAHGDAVGGHGLLLRCEKGDVLINKFNVSKCRKFLVDSGLHIAERAVQALDDCLERERAQKDLIDKRHIIQREEMIHTKWRLKQLMRDRNAKSGPEWYVETDGPVPEEYQTGLELIIVRTLPMVIGGIKTKVDFLPMEENPWRGRVRIFGVIHSFNEDVPEDNPPEVTEALAGWSKWLLTHNKTDRHLTVANASYESLYLREAHWRRPSLKETKDGKRFLCEGCIINRLKAKPGYAEAWQKAIDICNAKVRAFYAENPDVSLVAFNEFVESLLGSGLRRNHDS